MNAPIFQFGELRPEFEVRVLNERAVRASAGILFVFAFIAFMNAWLVGNFAPTRTFVLVFLFDFSIRLFINPQLAPSMVVGQWMVRRQVPEYVGAPQKRFAWALGFGLALMMAYLVVFKQLMGPFNLLICGVCLTLMFFESAFGICIGCKLYNGLMPAKAQLCPGGVCDVTAPPSPSHSKMAWLSLGCLVVFIALLRHWGPTSSPGPEQTKHRAPAVSASQDAAEAERCRVPDFAKAMGHEDKWKLHNNCK